MQVFATRTVTCVGQIIGIIVADTEAHAREAARAVAIDYQELPALVSIDDAIEAGSYYEVRPCTSAGKPSCCEGQAGQVCCYRGLQQKVARC